MAKTVSLVYNGKPGDTGPTSVYNQVDWAVGEIRDVSPEDAKTILGGNPSQEGEAPYFEKAKSSAAPAASTSTSPDTGTAGGGSK